MKSCKTSSIECDDMDCGDRDSEGLHWPGGHPMSRQMKNWHAEYDPATKGDIRRILEAIEVKFK